MYVPIGESIEDSTLELEYTFHRLLTSEPLFWMSLAGMSLWLIALVIFAIMSAQIKKYNMRHERDNVIINESIETFTGFIDAKDPYTNGHSKRVAIYTRCLAEEMGYAGEELEKNKGRQFDPEIAEIMLRLLRENRLPSVSETIPNNA